MPSIESDDKTFKVARGVGERLVKAVLAQLKSTLTAEEPATAAAAQHCSELIAAL